MWTLAINLIILCFCLAPVSNVFGQLEWGQQVVESTIKRSPSGLGSWTYPAGFYLFGQYRIWKLTGNDEYFQMIKNYVDSHVDTDGHIDAGISSLDNSQPGLITLLMYVETGEEKYKLAADYIRNIYNTYPRTSDGAFWHTNNNGGQIWLDGVYMILPFLANYAHVVNDTSLYTEVAHQIITYASHLEDPSGLLFHAFDESGASSWADPITHHSPFFWGRSMGWFGMAIVEILEVMPVDHPERAQLIEILKNLIIGLSNVQDEATGLWYQIVDKGDHSDNWLESSCSCMYSYFIARAVYKGYIDSSYLDMAIKAYHGILNEKFYMGTDGLANLKDISAGTSVSADYSYYINRSRNTNDLHGLGAFLMMCWQLEQTGISTNINLPPIVNFTSPLDSSSFWTFSDISMTVNSFDLDGTVVQVKFYEGDHLLYTDDQEPWEFTWEQVPEGNYTLTAHATDDSNATTISDPVYIKVSRDAMIIEAENGTISDGSVDTDHSGYTGEGFVNLVNQIDTYLEVPVAIPESGTWELCFRYSNGTTDNRPCSIRIDGNTAREQFDFLPTTNWDIWDYSDTLSLSLTAGDHTIRITGLTSASAPNLDHLKFTLTSPASIVQQLLANQPVGFQLYQNYPNPFNPQTTISFALPKAATVSINLYDINGRLIRKLVNDKYQAGVHKKTFDGTNLGSGVYFICARMLSSDKQAVLTKKMIILK
jgi:unsaturated rhamnogalacturonyl hydrolase